MEGRKLVGLDQWLYRRVFLPEKKYLDPDGFHTSRAFKLREKDKGELSVDVKSLTTAQQSVADTARFFLLEVSNEVVHGLGLLTFHDPLDDGSNDAHAVITGMTVEDDIIPGLLTRACKRVRL